MDTRKQNQYNDYYIEGNTARKLQVIPNYREEQEEQNELRRQPVRKIRKKHRIDSGIDIFSLLILTAAIVITLYTCIEYLGVQSRISQNHKQIAELESNLLKLQNQNSDSLSQINTTLDLNYIYQVATDELGMVYPKENQVIPYISTVSDYVRQYEDIPEENSKTLFDEILR